MATVTIPGFIYIAPDSHGEPHFTFLTVYGMESHGYTLVAPHTITVELPEGFNPSAGIVAALERKLAVAKDEAAKAEKELARLREVAGKES